MHKNKKKYAKKYFLNHTKFKYHYFNLTENCKILGIIFYDNCMVYNANLMKKKIKILR